MQTHDEIDNEYFHRCNPNESEDLYDARGIYCGRVCDTCRKRKMAAFRPEIFTDPYYETMEPVEPDEEDNNLW